MKKDNSKYIAICLAILTIFVVVISFITNKESQVDDEKPQIVTNYSNFYTVNSCLYRLITYIEAKDYESLLLVLNEKFIKENNITKDNVLNYFDEVFENSTFVSQKMYYVDLTDTLTKYYVKGYIKENKLYDGESIEKETKNIAYFIVYLDTSNNIFSIEPYNGSIFKAGDTNEK